MSRHRPITRNARSLGHALVASIALVVFVACGDRGDPGGPRSTIVLITLDTTRADHLSLYGYDRPTDASLVALAARSRVFDAAVAPATWTLPSHATMFTGLDPAEHGAWLQAHPEDPDASHSPPLSEEVPLVSGRLAAAGYHLVGVSGGPFTGARYGFARDFDVWHGIEGAQALTSADINAHLAEALAARPTDEPLFLFVNYFDAHSPYDPPAGRDYPFPQGVGDLPAAPALSQDEAQRTPERIQLAIDQYDRELFAQDEALGELLGWLEEGGLLQDALVIVTADHGEAFGEQELVGHSGMPIEPLAHVPLVVHRSEGPVDRIATPVSLANIPATMLAAAGLPDLPAGGSARFDLLAFPSQAPPAYSEHRSSDRWIGMLRQGPLKYYCKLPMADESAAFERLVELGADRGESLARAWSVRDWQGAAPELLTRGLALQRRLRAVVGAWLPAPDPAPPIPLTEEEQKMLREFGYL
ncbi:MAG: sulfatase [Planctomycetota bacterium]|jgi:arylsulfatase A-like enzyme